MFEEVPFILGFMMVSVVISYLSMHYIGSPLSKIFKALTLIGIVIHELFHCLMCIITRTPIENVTLVKSEKSEKTGRIEFYGEVNVSDRISFLQAFLVSFAPLYLSFWIFFGLLSLLINVRVNAVIFAICIFIMISLVLSAYPSSSDFKTILKAFQLDTRNSLYQFVLIGLSFLITWITIMVFELQYFHEILIYLIIAGYYFAFKYGFKISYNLLQSINRKKLERHRRIHNRSYRGYVRRKYKP
ncbi:MAG: hypothetical protein ACFFCI_09025 [Promethearchaeota archaeon]